MKNRTIICLIYLSTLPILSFGQQATTNAERLPDAFQLLEIQRGELEFFMTIVYRFEVAWEESDVESMGDLRVGLLKMMASEAKQLEEKSSATPKSKQRLAQAQGLMKQAEASPFLATDPAFGKQAESNKAIFNDFIQILEADFTEQSATLRQ